ncbi:MAG TPA: shikimate kinase [Kofleriaceae bacterium]|nr:shikimate kinase [Kofleriaceae bacterium]
MVLCRQVLRPGGEIGTTRIPVLVGLPGAGKSTIAKELGLLLGRPVFFSDAFFRECRALPKGSSDPRREITCLFLARIATLCPERLAAIQADAENVDAENRCLLHDGNRFRRHGEDAFRQYESQMLSWAWARGLLSELIPDLSASAPLFEENRRLFSKDNGYVPVLVETPHDAICHRVIADYTRVRSQRALRQRAASIRGRYEKLFDEALAAAALDSDPQPTLETVATAAVAGDAAQRTAVYRGFAELTFVPAVTATAAENALGILSLIQSSNP